MKSPKPLAFIFLAIILLAVIALPVLPKRAARRSPAKPSGPAPWQRDLGLFRRELARSLKGVPAGQADRARKVLKAYQGKEVVWQRRCRQEREPRPIRWNARFNDDDGGSREVS